MLRDRTVLDTNVLISAALLPASTPSAVLHHVLSTGVLILSNETFAEIATRLMRRKFDRYVNLALRQRFLVDLAAACEWTTITGALHVCRVADDNAVLETARAGDAGCLVTGGNDLLTLHPFGDLPIVSPRDFLKTRK